MKDYKAYLTNIIFFTNFESKYLVKKGPYKHNYKKKYPRLFCMNKLLLNSKYDKYYKLIIYNYLNLGSSIYLKHF